MGGNLLGHLMVIVMRCLMLSPDERGLDTDNVIKG